MIVATSWALAWQRLMIRDGKAASENWSSADFLRQEPASSAQSCPTNTQPCPTEAQPYLTNVLKDSAKPQIQPEKSKS